MRVIHILEMHIDLDSISAVEDIVDNSFDPAFFRVWLKLHDKPLVFQAYPSSHLPPNWGQRVDQLRTGHEKLIELWKSETTCNCQHGGPCSEHGD